MPKSEENIYCGISPLFEKRIQIFLATAFLIAAVGVIFSLYTVRHHMHLEVYGDASSFLCNISDLFSCDKVVRTKYSLFMGVPLGAWGGAYFFSVIVLLSLAMFIPKRFDLSSQTYSVMVLIGVAVSLIYATISYYSVGAFCLSCTLIYLTTFAQLLLIIVFRKDISRPLRVINVIVGGSVSLAVVALLILGFKALKPYIYAPDFDSPKISSDSGFQSQENSIDIFKTPLSGLGEDYRIGGDSAKVVLVEFSDFQCPACAYAADYFKKLHEQYGDKILIVFKNYPLDKSCNKNVGQSSHNFACSAAIVARCAGKHGKFWEFHDVVFQSNRELASASKGAGEGVLKKMAMQTGLSSSDVERCLSSRIILDKVQSDILQGDHLGVTATPTIFLNGKRFIGRSYLEIGAEIDRILSK